MGIGSGLILLAVGAVLRYAIEPYAFGQNVNLDVVGLILMVVGGIGIVLSLFIDSWRTIPGWRRDPTL